MQAPSRRIPQRLAASSRSLSCSTVMSRVTAVTAAGPGGPPYSGGGHHALGLGMISERETDIVDGFCPAFAFGGVGVGGNGDPACAVFPATRPTPNSMPASAPSSQPRSPSYADLLVPSFPLSLSAATGGAGGRGPGPCALSLFQQAPCPARKVSCGATFSSYSPSDAISSGSSSLQRKTYISCRRVPITSITNGILLCLRTMLRT